MKKTTARTHLHIENRKASPWIFHITDELWRSAAKRHAKLAARVDVTIGWDGDILDAALKTADCMIAPSPPREKLRERAPRLKWIHNRGAGIDHLLPLDWLPADAVLTNNSGVHGTKCEDYCTMALLMLATRMPAMLDSQRAGRWEPLFTIPIAGKTAVVIGFGDLGSAAGRAAKKLGLKVIAVTRSGKAGRPADAAYKVSSLERVLPKADFVIMTAPLTPQTRGLLNRERLALLKPSAGLINVGRSPLVDYDAVREMLTARKLAGALLDVHSPEPLPADSPLWTTPNLVVTPHISCDDPRYIDFLLDRWFENFARFLAGKPLANQVDRRLGY